MPRKKATKPSARKVKEVAPVLTREQELNASSRCAKCAKHLPEGSLVKDTLRYCSPACSN